MGVTPLAPEVGEILVITTPGLIPLVKSFISVDAFEVTLSSGRSREDCWE
jgi:hypothetical protein